MTGSIFPFNEWVQKHTVSCSSRCATVTSAQGRKSIVALQRQQLGAINSPTKFTDTPRCSLKKRNKLINKVTLILFWIWHWCLRQWMQTILCSFSVVRKTSLRSLVWGRKNVHSWPVITQSGDFHLGANQNILLGTPKCCTVAVGVRFLMWMWIEGFLKCSFWNGKVWDCHTYSYVLHTHRLRY